MFKHVIFVSRFSSPLFAIGLTNNYMFCWISSQVNFVVGSDAMHRISTAYYS